MRLKDKNGRKETGEERGGREDEDEVEGCTEGR
jgi:hypothetical protein